MLKKTVTFEDYNGNKITDDFYFNLNKAELIQWMSTTGNYTLDQVLEQIVKEVNGQKIMETFEDLMRRSYGVKSMDGRTFDKSDEIWKRFRNSEAYSEIFTQIVTSGKAAADFVNGIIPKELAKEVAKIAKENPEAIPENIREYMPDVSKEVK